MHLLFIYEDNGSVMRSLPRIHFLNELEHDGHVISIFNPLNFSDIYQSNEVLVKIARQKSVDLMVCLHGDDLIFVDTVKEFKRSGIPSLLICSDNLHAPFIHRKIAPQFDLVWLTSFETMPLFQRWGCHCIFLPYAANPYVFRPRFTDEINTVGFVGTPYGTRIMKINDLLKQGIHCSIYSDNLKKESQVRNHEGKKTFSIKLPVIQEDLNLLKFPIGRKILASKIKKKIIPSFRLMESKHLHVYPSVSFEEMNQLYSNFALSLGITEVWDTYLLKSPVHKIHLRTFEIPMCGGLQFAPYIEELAGYFEDGKEIVMYRTKDEYVDKATYYLREDKNKERMKMKINARKRAESEHTWKKRFDKAFAKLNLNEKLCIY